jgi:hypothetical protein
MGYLIVFFVVTVGLSIGLTALCLRSERATTT